MTDEKPKNIYQKLLLAQMEIGAIKKEQSNPFFHSFYADINAILAVVKPILNKNGLVLLQGIDFQVVGMPSEIKMILTTIVKDSESDGQIKCQSPLPQMPDPQKQGSAITYFRRYALQSLLALEAQDDDGNTASDKEEKGYKYPPSYTPKKNSKVENDFMGDLEPTDEEVITFQERLEAAKDITELKKIWTTVPPMVKDKLEKIKNELKMKLV